MYFARSGAPRAERLAVVGVLLGLLGAATNADARPKLGVLAFGGDDGMAARSRVVAALRRSYRIVDGETVLAACEELGVRLERGRSLARVSEYLGVVALIGGAAGGGKLAVVVYSGLDGQPLVTGAVKWSPGEPLRRALRLIREGLSQVQPAVQPPDEPAPPPPAQPPEGVGGGTEPLSFDPEPVQQSAETEGEGIQVDEEAENPLAPPPAATSQPAVEVTKTPEPPREPRVVAFVGLGAWVRDFSLNDPVDDRDHPDYDSGPAFTLRFALRGRPLAFFLEGIPAQFWLRLRYQVALGQSSQIEGEVSDLTTSQGELLFDAGYQFNFGSRPDGPQLDVGLGYGLLDFSIDWGSNEARMPDSAYRFLLLGAEFRYPFGELLHSRIGGHLRLDYRIVFEIGEIEREDDDAWYGPSTTGGLAAAVGLHVATVFNIVGTLEYSYTRFFYAFDDAVNRQEENKRAAGGALDQYHSVVFSAGYSY
jgi:hypothetical protein